MTPRNLLPRSPANIPLSVIICTHNPKSDYLSRTLESLKAQSLPRGEWELLLVDNRSTELLSPRWDLSWHPLGRHVREDELGLTAARARAIHEAVADQIVFFDDDNVVEEHYLEQAIRIGGQCPFLGAFGSGALRPEFEVRPSPQAAQFLHMLALRTVNSALWSNNTKHWDCLPWGAGLCVAREVANGFREMVAKMRANRFLGPRGEQLFRGDDDLFSLVAAGRGLGFGIFPELQITHLIPAKRVEPAYFLRLISDHRLSHTVLTYFVSGELPTKAAWSESLKIALHGFHRGGFSMRCRWNAFRGEKRAIKFINEHTITPLSLYFGGDARPPVCDAARRSKGDELGNSSPSTKR